MGSHVRGEDGKGKADTGTQGQVTAEACARSLAGVTAAVRRAAESKSTLEAAALGAELMFQVGLGCGEEGPKGGRCSGNQYGAAPGLGRRTKTVRGGQRGWGRRAGVGQQQPLPALAGLKGGLLRLPQTRSRKECMYVCVAAGHGRGCGAKRVTGRQGQAQKGVREGQNKGWQYCE